MIHSSLYESRAYVWRTMTWVGNLGRGWALRENSWQMPDDEARAKCRLFAYEVWRKERTQKAPRLENRSELLDVGKSEFTYEVVVTHHGGLRVQMVKVLSYFLYSKKILIFLPDEKPHVI